MKSKTVTVMLMEIWSFFSRLKVENTWRMFKTYALLDRYCLNCGRYLRDLRLRNHIDCIFLEPECNFLNFLDFFSSVSIWLPNCFSSSPYAYSFILIFTCCITIWLFSNFFDDSNSLQDWMLYSLFSSGDLLIFYLIYLIDVLIIAFKSK